MKTNSQRIVWNVPQIRWLFLLLGVFESGLERLLIFPSALLFVLLHFLFCAEETEVIKTYTPSTQNYAEWNAAYDRFKTLL